MNDDRLEESVLRALESVTAPPETPRAAMWDRITAGWGAQLGPDRVVELPPRRRRSPWVAIVQVAAVLAIGIAVGRATVSRAPAVRTRIDSGWMAATEPRSASLSSVLTQHLSDAEVLLTEFRSEMDPPHDLAARASDLLGTTRHLLDAPAARDPELHAVLEDLELVLVQLVRLQSARDEAGFVRETLEHRDLPGRLRVGTSRGI